MTVQMAKLRLRKFTMLSMTDMNKKNGCGALPETWGFYAIIGSKSSKTSKNGNPYLRFSLTDFNNQVSCMIFKKELRQKFYKWSEGTVVIVLSPKVLKSDNKSFAAMAITLENENQMIELGQSKDLGFCQATRGDNSNTCGKPIDKSIGNVCAFHLNTQYKRQSGRRADVNRAATLKPQFSKTQNNMSKGVFHHKGSMIMCVAPSSFKQTKKKIIKSHHRVPENLNRKSGRGHSTRSTHLLTKGYQQKRVEDNKRLVSLAPSIGKNWNSNQSIAVHNKQARKRSSILDILEIDPNRVSTTNLSSKRKRKTGVTHQHQILILGKRDK
eukprot:UN22982